MGDDDVSQRRMEQQRRRIGIDQRAVRHAVDHDAQLLERLLLRVIPGDEPHIRQGHGEQPEDRSGRPQPRRVVVPRDHHHRNASPFEAAHLAHEVRQRRPGWPGVMENVAGVQHQIDVSGEDVGNRGREAVLDVDGALVPPRFRIGFSVGGVAEMRIRQVRNAKATSRESLVE